MEDVRSSMQAEAVKAWFDGGGKGSVIVGTGGGKSKIALEIIKKIGPLRILLLTNATALRDTNWKEEYQKFGLLGYWENTTSATYQAMYDRDWGDVYDLVILDEVDFACTLEYGRCLDRAQKCKAVIAMTGFITDEKREMLEYYFPICYEASTEDLQKDGLVNKSEIIFVEFPLSKERTIEKKLKRGGTFKSSENGEYEYWDKQFQKAMIVKGAIERKCRLLGENYENSKEWKSADWNFKLTATKRKHILHNLTSSALVVNEILDKVRKVGNKVLIFSTLKNQCDKFPNPYHESKTTVSYKDLNEGTIDVLSVVKKIARGVNLVGVNYLIRESYDGSEEIFQQTHGRLLRLRTDQWAKYIVLIPYYEALTRTKEGKFEKTMIVTQAGKWAEKMMQSFETDTIRTIKLDSTYKINSDTHRL